MNRQEAAIIIKAIGKHAIETHLTDPGDILDATVIAVEALVPKPDEVTGLVPCGCGGVAISEDYFGDDDVESSYRAFVSCEKCELRTPDYPRLFDAKEAWNTAMGYTPPGANSPEIEWISVKDRLPEMTDTEDYIVFDRTGTPHVVVAVKTENGGNCQEAEIGREDK